MGFGMSFGIRALMGETKERGVLPTVGMAAIDTAAMQLMPGYQAWLTGQAAFGATKALSELYYRQKAGWAELHTPFSGRQFTDTQQAQTMRQRAVQAIQESRMNARSAIGSEARLMHDYSYSTRPYGGF